MLRLLIDENINNHILRGLQLRLPQLDFLLVKQVGLAGSPDSVLLEWAARDQRTILTHDVKTMPSLRRTTITEFPTDGRRDFDSGANGNWSRDKRTCIVNFDSLAIRVPRSNRLFNA